MADPTQKTSREPFGNANRDDGSLEWFMSNQLGVVPGQSSANADRRAAEANGEEYIPTA